MKPKKINPLIEDEIIQKNIFIDALRILFVIAIIVWLSMTVIL